MRKVCKNNSQLEVTSRFCVKQKNPTGKKQTSKINTVQRAADHRWVTIINNSSNKSFCINFSNEQVKQSCNNNITTTYPSARLLLLVRKVYAPKKTSSPESAQEQNKFTELPPAGLFAVGEPTLIAGIALFCAGSALSVFLGFHSPFQSTRCALEWLRR